MSSTPGDFAAILEEANAPSRSPTAHPFGGPRAGLLQNGDARGAPVRQTTSLFYAPQDLVAYDEVCNRVFAGEIEIRFEERYTTKEGEIMILLCFFERGPQPGRAPADNAANPGVEPQERARRLP